MVCRDIFKLNFCVICHFFQLSNSYAILFSITHNTCLRLLKHHIKSQSILTHVYIAYIIKVFTNIWYLLRSSKFDIQNCVYNLVIFWIIDVFIIIRIFIVGKSLISLITLESISFTLIKIYQ